MISPRTWARKAVWAMDRPVVRRLLPRLLPRLARSSPDGVAELRFDRGWVHRFGDVWLVEPKPRLTAPELSEARNHYVYGSVYMPGPGEIVLDVGAGLGWEALFYARRVSRGGRVIAVEAHPILSSFLKRSAELNGFDNITVVEAAVAAERGRVLIENNLNDHIGNAIGQADAPGGIDVEALSIDEICSSTSIGHVDFLKMNIEGAERLALQGMDRLVGNLKVVCISCHDFLYDRSGNEFFRTKAFVEKFFVDRGFVIVPREDGPPEVTSQVNAYDPKLISKSQLACAGR